MNYSQPGVVFTSEDLLQEFVDAAHDDALVSLSVQELTVRIYNPIAPTTLHQSFAVAPFITDLVLCLSLDTPFDFLDDVRLPHLELFKTNLPHSHLLHFLPAHPSVTDLCLDVCGRRLGYKACPLRVLDLQHVSTIECPLDCVPDVTHAGVLRLTAESQQRSPDASTMLRSLRTPLPSLIALTLDVVANDYDILRSVVHYVPTVEQLKLLERPISVQRRQVHARRAWNDAKT